MTSESLCGYSESLQFHIMISQKKTKVDAIKNNRLIPNYLQTCSNTFCIYIVEKYLFLFYFCIFFSEE